MRDTTPRELRTEQTAAFLIEALRGRHRVLEVGCGRGDVARKLGSAGHEVTALDLEIDEPAPTPRVTYVEHDFLAYETQPFDAVVFTSSLHHISPLADTVARASKLLVPYGLLVVDELDLDAPDADTLRWYYDVQELLVAAELYPPERLDAGAEDEPLGRWRAGHDHDPPLHSGAHMRVAISDRFVIRELRTVEYLYRYIAAGLADDEHGGAIAAHVLATERRRIADHRMLPVGLRIVADRV